MAAINFPASPSNGDTHQGFVYNSTLGVWQSAASQTAVTSFTGLSDTPSALGTAGQIAKVNSGGTALEFADQSGVTVYANVDALPSSGNAGDLAFVSATNRLYIWNGSGWYNIALINTNPTISGANSAYELASDGTPTVITITATDPEGLPITYSIASDTSGNTATVTQGTGANTNVFTITPSTNDADAGTFSLTFRASDGVNIASAISEFTLAFQVQNSNYTTALITSVGTNNQVNNTFVDSSTNSHTITVAGNVTQNTFSPYRHGGYSIYCDGANVMDLGFSTLQPGDWTFECWMKLDGYTGDAIVLGKYGGGNQLEAFGVSGTTGYMMTHTNVGVETPTCNTDLRDGKWHYLVWERYNGTYYYWADGSLETSFSNSETPGATGNWIIGGVASSRFKGSIKEARFSLSTAVYSGNAPTTPTEPQTTSNATDAFFTGVGLEIKDYSSNNRTFTVPSTFVSAPTAPYDYIKYSAGTNGGSMYFSDGNAYLTASPTAPGTGDFCYECWINVSQASDDAIFDTRTPASSASGFTLTVLDPSTIRIYSDSADVTASGLSYLNQWTHLCVEKVGSTTTLYVNGTSFGTTTAYSNMSDTSLRIGESPHYGAFSGHIADFRYVRGGYVYNGNFTPPTAPLTAISGTELLINGTNAGIIDKSQSVKTITLNGDVKSSTAQTKYLTSSMAFDGTGDYLNISSSEIHALGSGDYTVECWVYLNSSKNQGIWDTRTTNTSTTGVALYVTSGNEWRMVVNNSTFTVGGSITNSTWTHVAVVRSGSTITVYVAGSSVNTATSSINLTDESMLIATLRDNVDTSATFKLDGYMSDFRVTKGLARYTANFTPPTAALQG